MSKNSYIAVPNTVITDPGLSPSAKRVYVAMLACSMLAVSFSSIYFILLSGTAGLCVYGVRQLRRGGGKP